MRTGRLLTAAIAGIGLFAAGLVGGPGPSAGAAVGDIRPGVSMITNGAQCTANFIYRDAASTYIGYAAHCAGTGGATDTDGCRSGSLPLGTPVQIDGAEFPGALAYSSWATMQAVGETDADACNFNDLALVRLDPRDLADVSPTVPHWGGPTDVNTGGAGALTTVYSYGNSSLRLGLELLSPKTGVSLGTTGGGWTHPVYTVTPGIPGDSGSAFLDDQGRALGVLSTLALLPTPLANGVSDINRMVGYMQANGGPQAEIVLGGPFNPSQLPLDLTGGLGLGGL